MYYSEEILRHENASAYGIMFYSEAAERLGKVDGYWARESMWAAICDHMVLGGVFICLDEYFGEKCCFARNFSKRCRKFAYVLNKHIYRDLIQMCLEQFTVQTIYGLLNISTTVAK